MSSVNLEVKRVVLADGLISKKYRTWQLVIDAVDPVATNGTEDDPNIFTIRVHKTADGDQEVFSHVSTLYDMQNLPVSKSELPPKSRGLYRSSRLELEFRSIDAIESAVDDIQVHTNFLMREASNSDINSTEVIGCTG